MNYKAHLLVQVTSFVLIPAVVKVITLYLDRITDGSDNDSRGAHLNRTLLAGMAITSATPTTISSNVVMTANAFGNESLALFNAALGNLLGVFFSPLIVVLLLQGTAEAPGGGNGRNGNGGSRHGLDYTKILRELGTTILFPIIFGQLYLYYFPRSVAWMRSKVHFPTLNSACLLILVWTVFCDAFYNHTFDEVKPIEIVLVGIVEAGVFWATTFFLGAMARIRPCRIRLLKITDQHAFAQQQQRQQQEEGQTSLLGQQQAAMTTTSGTSPESTHLLQRRNRLQEFCEPMSKADTVAVLFCGATKSVAMGIPLIKIMYSSGPGSSLAGLLATPLLIYHVEQLFFGAFMVSWLKKWVALGEETLDDFGPRHHHHHVPNYGSSNRNAPDRVQQ
ncbi:hypothetical protein BG004_000152 [Podila humilis]|nr:hypothetical protein BG004_000152 [Podila humilis]